MTLNAASTSGGFNYRVTGDSDAVKYFFVERNNDGAGVVKLRQTIAGQSKSSYNLIIHAGPPSCDDTQVSTLTLTLIHYDCHRPINIDDLCVSDSSSSDHQGVEEQPSSSLPE